MPFLILIVYAFVALLSAWSVVFQLGIALDWSVRAVTTVFAIASLLMAAATVRGWLGRLRRVRPAGWAFAGRVVALGVVLGLLVLVVSRPDADDVGYVYQYLVDVRSPDRPFTSEPFRLPFGGAIHTVPGLTENESYEAMAVAVASALGMDPLAAYHNAFPFFLAILWVVVTTLLLLRFRVGGRRSGRRRVLWAVVAIVVFLLLDGNLHRSYGNFAFVRLWQGKVVGYFLLLPIFLWASLRFFARPTARRFLLLAATAWAGVMVNRSLLFMLPVLIFGLVVARFAGQGRLRSDRRQLAWILGIAGVAGAAGLYILQGVAESAGLRELTDAMIHWRTATGRRGLNWWETFRWLVVSDPLVIVRDLFFLLVVPLLALPRSLRTFLPTLSAAILLAAFTPWTGAAFFHLAGNVSWRLYYLFPLPLCVGLAAGLPFARGPGLRRRLGLYAAAVAVILTLASVEQPVLAPSNRVHLKHPASYRLEPLEAAFSRAVAPSLRGRRVLAPNEVSTALSLLEPTSIDYVYARRSGGHPLERFASECRLTPETIPPVRHQLLRGLEVVILPPCDPAIRREMDAAFGRRFSFVEEAVPVPPRRIYRVYRVTDRRETAGRGGKPRGRGERRPRR